MPYRVLGGLRFTDRKEVKDVLAYLCLINNPSNNVRLMRIINEPALSRRRSVLAIRLSTLCLV